MYNLTTFSIFFFHRKIYPYPGRRFRRPNPAGSCRKDAEKSPYPAGKHRKSLERGSSIPAGNCSDFFRSIPANFLRFPAGTGRKSSEKIRKISGRNTASTKSLELPGTGRFRAGLFYLGSWISSFGEKCCKFVSFQTKSKVNQRIFLRNDTFVYLVD